VRVPEHAVIGSIDEATVFADRHVYPVVLKRPYDRR
jgi:glutathione synthase/RimK-type ligase-like ATP-grasp enzyme